MRRLDAERSLDELAGLAQAAGAEVVLRVLQERPKPDPSTFLGAGKIKTLAASCAETDVDLVIVDNELTPAQLRQIEEAVERKIVDRTQLILDIFARRARTREGKLQVELAQLKYLLPRLVGVGRRAVPPRRRHRHARTRRNQAGNRSPPHPHADSRGLRKTSSRSASAAPSCASARQKASVPTVALVGYTNAGKTTLFNELTRADAEASERAVRRPSIRSSARSACPTVASCWCPTRSASSIGCRTRWSRRFAPRSRRLAEADLVLHVIDAAAPDRDRRMSSRPHACSRKSARIDVPMLEVYNKCDALTPDERRRLQRPGPVGAEHLRAHAKEGLEELIDTIASRLELDVVARHADLRS